MADIFDMADVWNNGATTFAAIKMNVTDTSSASASLLLDLQVASTSKFSVRKDGLISANGFTSTGVLTVSNTSTLTGAVTASNTFALTGAATLSNTLTISNGGNSTVFAITVGNSTVNTIANNTSISSNKIIHPDAGVLTIATGAITATGSYHTVDTQGGAGTDDLDTINGGADGMLLVLQAENTARDVVVKDGTGNIQCAGDFTMDNTQDSITLMYSGALSAWVELARSNNGA
jgi:hypothetical protein